MSSKPCKPRPSVISVTESAADRLREIIDGKDQEIAGVRIGVKNGGCAGMSYTMDYATEVSPLDEVVEQHGVTVLVDPKAVLFLLGTQMDYEVTTLSSGFVFNNPNQTSACGCGESIAITPASAEALKALA